MRNTIYLSILIFSFFFTLNAEIQLVTIKWTSTLCKESCGKGLEEQFRKIPAVQDVYVNLAAGQADLKWKPNSRFSYEPIRLAMHMIGLYINDIRVKVVGTIKHDAHNNFSLVSTGDGTIFYLKNPIRPVANQYVEKYNPENRGLSQDLQSQLLEGETNQQIATIEGPLFQAYRSPTLQLVVEHLQFANKTDNSK